MVDENVKQCFTNDEEKIDQMAIVVNAIKVKDGSLGKILSSCFDENGWVDLEIAKKISKTYSQSTNNSPCPCGSGLKFEKCCKQAFRFFERQVKKQKTHEKVKKQEEHREAVEESQIKWVAKIGIDKNGSVKIDIPEDGQPVVIPVLADILHKAWMEIFMTMMIQITDSRRVEAERQKLSVTDNMPKNPFTA